MKKNIHKYILLSAALMAATISCRDEDAIRFPDLEEGINARVIPDKDALILNLLDLPNSALLFDIYSQNNNIQEITYYVTFTDASYPDQKFQTVELITVPGSAFSNGKATGIKKTAAELAEALELPGGLNYLDGGDHFTFTTKATLTDGRTFDASNSAPSITNGTNASFTVTWDLYVACPFKISDAIGTYDITIDAIGAQYDTENPQPVEVVRGDNDNQAILKHLFAYPAPNDYDVVVDVDPVTGIATVDTQKAWFHPTYLVGSVGGSGFFFSCTGTLNLNLQYTVAAGSFGTYGLQLMKQ